MADDYDNTDDIQNMSDGELRAYILAALASQKTIDFTDVTVNVNDGKVRLDGRVGTEEELRIIDHIVTDLTGLTEIDNEMVVDELMRAQSPEAIENDILKDGLADITLLEDEDAGGTHDILAAIEEAEPWIPPEGPTPEGVSGQEDGNFGIDGQR
ncbi:MAG: BON domain-containing protein [Gemmatimonadales bacterium]